MLMLTRSLCCSLPPYTQDDITDAPTRLGAFLDSSLVNTINLLPEEIMTTIVSREIHLKSRASGLPTADNFVLKQIQLEPLSDQQVLVRNLYLSVDPYMRGRMNDVKSEMIPPFELGQPLEGAAVGEVVESRAEAFKVGDIVTSNLGWREYAIAQPSILRQVGREVQPLSVHLGVLGMTGLTAWVGLNLVEVKAGETIFISGAAGAVGSVAGQLAKLRGCRVIGTAGSAEKIRFLKEECGFDFAFDYKTGTVLEQLNQAAPDGIDVYFDQCGERNAGSRDHSFTGAWSDHCLWEHL